MPADLPGFTGAPIDRADALRQDASALARERSSLSARLLRLDGLDPQLDEQGQLQWGSLAEAEEGADLVFLGLVDGRSRWVPVPPAGRRLDPRSRAVWRVLSLLSPQDMALYGMARSLADWHHRHRYCATCGQPTLVAKGGWQRDCAPELGGCGAQHFPRTDPVVIMLAEFGGKVLVGRQALWPARTMSALAGFIEPGESMEEAVARELAEEAGVRVVPGGVRYVTSQPWPFPSQLMIAAIAQVESGTLQLDEHELEQAIWVDAAQVRAALDGDAAAPFAAPQRFAVAHSLLARWCESVGR